MRFPLQKADSLSVFGITWRKNSSHWSSDRSSTTYSFWTSSPFTSIQIQGRVRLRKEDS